MALLRCGACLHLCAATNPAVCCTCMPATALLPDMEACLHSAVCLLHCSCLCLLYTSAACHLVKGWAWRRLGILSTSCTWHGCTLLAPAPSALLSFFVWRWRRYGVVVRYDVWCSWESFATLGDSMWAVQATTRRVVYALLFLEEMSSLSPLCSKPACLPHACSCQLPPYAAFTAPGFRACPTMAAAPPTCFLLGAGRHVAMARRLLGDLAASGAVTWQYAPSYLSTTYEGL